MSTLDRLEAAIFGTEIQKGEREKFEQCSENFHFSNCFYSPHGHVLQRKGTPKMLTNRRGTTSLSVLGYDVPITWVAVIVGAIGVFAYFVSRRRGQPQRRPVAPPQGGGGPSRPAQQASVKRPASDALPDQLKAKAYVDWRVVITGDAFPSRTTEEVAVLKKFAASKKLLLVVRTVSAAEEADWVQFAERELAPLGFQRHQLIFCNSVKGEEAIVRQFKPILFLSANGDLVKFMKQFLPHVAAVASKNPPMENPAIPKFDSLAQLELGE